jgi:NitT/TauT family transport system substrate-binding protein
MKRLGLFASLCPASVAFVSIALLLANAAQAQTKPLQKVRLMVATGVFDVTYSEFTLPSILGYWRDEGYDVDAQPAGGSIQVVQQVAGGGAELGAGSGNAFISGGIKGNVALKIAMPMRTTDWGVAVDANSSIKSAKDLKGKTIGVYNQATGGVLWLNELLIASGLDPKDVTLVPTGMGATPVQALQSGQVQGLLYWGSAIASFENIGLNLREIAGEDWKTYPDYSIGVTQALADKDPAMVIGVVRGIAKSLTFLAANPECALKLHWAAFPATKSPGDEAEVKKKDLHSIQRALTSIEEAYDIFGHKKYRGAFDDAAWERLIAFMVKTKQIDRPVPVQSIKLQIPDFVEKINDFDANAVRENAKACKF